MPITREDIEPIAKLAKLNFGNDEMEEIVSSVDTLLAHFAKLQELDTSDVEPLSHPHEIVNVFREDRIKPSLPVDKALENAPDKLGHFFKVPKVIK